MRWTKEQYEDYLAKKKATPPWEDLPKRDTGRTVKTSRMNKTEARYASLLAVLLRTGEIKGWKYESYKVRLADRTWFTPDFAVYLPSGTLRLVEVKGGFVRDDAKVKFKVAREQYSEHEWVMVQWSRGTWQKIA